MKVEFSKDHEMAIIAETAIEAMALKYFYNANKDMKIKTILFETEKTN